MFWHNTTSKFTIASKDFEPAYMKLHRSGELQKRAKEGLKRLEKCQVCPRNCDVDRLLEGSRTGVCKIGRKAIVSSYFPHFGEEDCLRGWKGSGTIFFSMCNLRCVFCQNYEISQAKEGREVDAQGLADIMIELQEIGCHNINFVTPEHVVPQILEAIPIAVEIGLRLPIVYNTSAYDSMDSLELMEDIVDIFMPDFKYWSAEMAKKYLKAKDYPEVTCKIVKQMHKMVGDLVVDENGLAKRGVLVRHLVMPDNTAGTFDIMSFLAQEVSIHTYVNIMAQYYPTGKVNDKKYSEINRRIYQNEYKQACKMAKEAGIYRFDERLR